MILHNKKKDIPYQAIAVNQHKVGITFEREGEQEKPDDPSEQKKPDGPSQVVAVNQHKVGINVERGMVCPTKNSTITNENKPTATLVKEIKSNEQNKNFKADSEIGTGISRVSSWTETENGVKALYISKAGKSKIILEEITMKLYKTSIEGL